MKCLVNAASKGLMSTNKNIEIPAGLLKDLAYAPVEDSEIPHVEVIIKFFLEDSDMMQIALEAHSKGRRTAFVIILKNLDVKVASLYEGEIVKEMIPLEEVRSAIDDFNPLSTIVLVFVRGKKVTPLYIQNDKNHIQ